MENIYNNPVVLKVHGGTVRGDQDLCATCRWAHRTVGSSTGSVKVRCSAIGPPNIIREPVAHCSNHLDRTKPTLEQMQEIAWQLQTDKGGRKLGFAPPDREKLERSAPVGF